MKIKNKMLWKNLNHCFNNIDTVQLSRVLFYLCFIPLLLVLSGCPEENPLLVNPPTAKDSILVRFINLVPNSGPLSATLDDVVSFQNIQPFTASKALASPGDSVFFKVQQNGTNIYSSLTRYRFIKSSVQTIIALPKVNTSQNTFDTVLVSTSSNFFAPGAFSSIRVLYITDNSQQFSLRSGCPNGTILTNAFLNQTPSNFQQIIPGDQTISLTKTLQDGSDSTIGTYLVSFAVQAKYTIIFTDYSNKGIKPFLLKEFDNSEQAFTELVPTLTQNVTLRTINVSSSPIDMFAGFTNQIETNLPSQYTSSFKQISACKSVFKDSIYSKIGSDVSSTSLLQFIPPRSYSIVVTDSKDNIADVSIPIEPLIPDTIPIGKARIRVVQANANFSGITVSVGARLDSDFSSNFTTGESIARQILFGSLSSGYFSKPGLLPLTVFDNATPTNLLLTSLVDIEPNQSYVLIFSKDPLSNEPKLSVVKDTDESMQITNLQKGTLLQFIHGINGLSNAKLSSGTILLDASFNFTNSIATCLPFGQAAISFNQNNFSINVDNTKRLHFFTEKSGAIQLKSFDFIPGGRLFGTIKRRFINASDLENVTITNSPKLNFDFQGNLENVEFENLLPDTESPLTTTNLSQRLSFFFWDKKASESKGNLVKSATNLSLPLGKNYSIILVGDIKNGYEVIITQEF